MIYLFLYNFYFSLWTNIVSFIKRKQVYPNEKKNNAAVTSSIIVALHTLVNLLCFDCHILHLVRLLFSLGRFLIQVGFFLHHLLVQHLHNL